MGIPCLQEIQAALDHQCTDAVQFVQSKSTRFGNGDRVQPELRDIVTMLDMDMRRLRSFETVEKESKSGNPQDRRHRRAPTDQYDFCRAPSTPVIRCLRAVVTRGVVAA
jgi:hypothetical protein